MLCRSPVVTIGALFEERTGTIALPYRGQENATTHILPCIEATSRVAMSKHRTRYGVAYDIERAPSAGGNPTGGIATTPTRLNK